MRRSKLLRDPLNRMVSGLPRWQMQSMVLYEAMNFWYLRRLFDPVLKPDAR